MQHATVRVPVFGKHQFFGTSEHYGNTHGSLSPEWMNYNYTESGWFPTSSNNLILPSQFWQIRFESYWLHCSKCRILVLLRYLCNHLLNLIKLLSLYLVEYIRAWILWTLYSDNDLIALSGTIIVPFGHWHISARILGYGLCIHPNGTKKIPAYLYPCLLVFNGQYIVSWEPEGRYHQKGATAVQSQWR